MKNNLVVVLMTAALAFIGSLSLNATDFSVANPKDIALFPQQNAYRNKLDLSGIWSFQLDPEGVGETEGWQNGLPNPASIAVPGSWNDQLDQQHNYLGYSWYETTTYVPTAWQGSEIGLRVGSAVYMAKVWINGQPVGMHEGGHLPFAFSINSFINSCFGTI